VLSAEPAASKSARPLSPFDTPSADRGDLAGSAPSKRSETPRPVLTGPPPTVPFVESNHALDEQEPSIMSQTKTTSKTVKNSHAHVVATKPEIAPSPALTSTPSVAASTPTTPPGDMPPAERAPATPAGWKASPAKGRGKSRGPKLTKGQITSESAAAKELAGSTTFTADFGPHTPPQATLAFLLANAAVWRVIWQGASQFATYAAEQRAAWDTAAQEQMAVFAPSFELAETREPVVAEKYPATAKFLGAKSEVAQRGASTRKAQAKAKAKAAEAPAPSPPVNTTTPAKTIN
jgi:hypothetical protein